MVGLSTQILPILRAHSRTEHPLSFSADMVRALLDGRKTQTRTVMKLPTKGEYFRPDMGGWAPTTNGGQGVFRLDRHGRRHAVPETIGIWNQTTGTCLDAQYQIGDLIYVRENGTQLENHIEKRNFIEVCGFEYSADYKIIFLRSMVEGRVLRSPRSSANMPRWASRLTLEVTGVKVQQLQEISAEDAQAEGIGIYGPDVKVYQANAYRRPEAAKRFDAFRIRQYRNLWNSTNGDNAWDSNPWVAALTFIAHKQNIDAFLKARAV